MVRHRDHHPETRMAGLASAPRRCCVVAPACPATCPAGSTIPSALGPCISAPRSIRIHGSNEPWTMGQAVSSGCIRMTNADVTDLYKRVSVGTTVVVLR